MVAGEEAMFLFMEITELNNFQSLRGRERLHDEACWKKNEIGIGRGR
jgi:hypothetical protein